MNDKLLPNLLAPIFALIAFTFTVRTTVTIPGRWCIIDSVLHMGDVLLEFEHLLPLVQTTQTNDRDR
jgi:hypothetical protein